ncbi:MAG: RloB domain-containing protein [Saccharofermentanales bacterium]
MKKTNLFYFSVEGENEKWYFEHVQRIINQMESSTYNVKMEIKIQKSPLKHSKTISSLYQINAFHICDYESNDKIHTTGFERTLAEMKSIKKTRKHIKYKLGYSNYTFDLWIIMHKIQFFSSFSDRTQYVKGINRAYSENFQFIDDYKDEKNFKRILSQIDIIDIKNAIKNAENIRDLKAENRCKISDMHGFKFYKENPDLTVHECVKLIFIACGVL